MATKRIYSSANKAKGFARRAIESDIVQAAADAIVTSEIDLNLSLIDGEVVIAHQMQVFFSDATLDAFYTQADTELMVGLVQSDDVTDLQLWARSRYGCKAMRAKLANNPVSLLDGLPLIIDWTQLPGGGLPIPPAPLHFALDSTNLGITAQGSMILYYTVVRVKPAEAMDMLQSLLPQSF